MNQQTGTWVPAAPDYAQIDFASLRSQPGFKEDSVREAVIAPLLAALGYGEAQIRRSHSLKHPFLRTGSRDRKVALVPDYAC